MQKETLVESESTGLTYDQVRRRNADGYALLFDIEVILRELIEVELASLHGRRWLKLGLPSDVREKAASGVAYEKRVPWKSLTAFRPLYYADFSDLKKILTNAESWKKSFADIFKSKSNLEATLSELEFVRNKIAHNRFLSEGDMTILEGAHAKIVGSLPSERLIDAKRKAIEHVPVLQYLQTLSDALPDGDKAIRCGERLSGEVMSALKAIHEWWFDETYLGTNVEPFQRLERLCSEYAGIPAGIGQGIVRARWADDHHLATCFAEAAATISVILEK